MKRVLAFTFALGASLVAQQPPAQTLQDEYAVYELLAPETNAFRTDYEAALTTAGATTLYDRIGSNLQSVPREVGGPDRAIDLMTGLPLQVQQRGEYLEVRLARPVPPDGGQARVRVLKTYKDPKSYFREGDAIVFSRSIGLRRAAFILPPGFHLLECNVPSQVLLEADGRIRVSLMNHMPGSAALVIKARPGAPTGDAAKPRALTNARSWEAPPAQGPSERARLTERAHQDRDIV